MPYGQIERALPDLRARKLALFVAVKADHPDYAGFSRLCTRARAQGVEIRPWLLLRQEQGYWFNKWNVPQSEAFVREFLAQMRKRGVRPDWLIFDVEPPADLTGEMERDLARRDFFALRSRLTCASGSSRAVSSSSSVRPASSAPTSRPIPSAGQR